MAILLIYALDLLFITFLSRFGWKALGFAAITNMILIGGVFSQKEIVFLGFQSNLGNVFYAATMFTISLCAAKQGVMGCLRLINAVAIAFVLFILMALCAVYLPTAPGNELVAVQLSALFRPVPQIMFASFISFYISQTINITLMERMDFSLWLRKPISNVIAQFADSAFFFTIAFYGIWSYDKILIAMMSGFVIKSILNIIDTPIWMLTHSFDFKNEQP